jgi:hypothetical protein
MLEVRTARVVKRRGGLRFTERLKIKMGFELGVYDVYMCVVRMLERLQFELRITRLSEGRPAWAGLVGVRHGGWRRGRERIGGRTAVR